MNGVHDVGGMTMLAMGRIDTLDAFRHEIERMDPAHYLSSSYYDY